MHEEGFQVARQPNGTLVFRRPDGRPLPDVPEPAAVPANPTDTLHVQNDAAGVQINARTTTPGWQGERLDVGYAISVLHPRATGSRALTSTQRDATTLARRDRQRSGGFA